MTIATLPEKVGTIYDSMRVYEIPLLDIENDDDWNCRGYIDPTDVIELAQDIRLRGLDQPITVMPNPRPNAKKKFKLVAGYRRYKAHQMIAATTIKAIVREGLDETQARILNLTENLQRRDLNIKQEAHAIARLRLMNKAIIAAKIGKSIGWVEVRLKLLELPDLIQDEAAAGRLTGSEIRKCSEMSDEAQMFAYVKKVKDAKLLGNKKPVDHEKIKYTNTERIRTSGEIEEMQTIIRKVLGNGLATRALGWAGGFIDDVEMHQSIRDFAAMEGKTYELPELGKDQNTDE